MKGIIENISQSGVLFNGPQQLAGERADRDGVRDAGRNLRPEEQQRRLPGPRHARQRRASGDTAEDRKRRRWRHRSSTTSSFTKRECASGTVLAAAGGTLRLCSGQSAGATSFGSLLCEFLSRFTSAGKPSQHLKCVHGPGAARCHTCQELSMKTNFPVVSSLRFRDRLWAWARAVRRSRTTPRFPATFKASSARIPAFRQSNSRCRPMTAS